MKPVVFLLAVYFAFASSCVPPCVKDGTCLPKPSPVPTVEPSLPPSPSPAPVPTPEPTPTPTPTPLPSAPPPIPSPVPSPPVCTPKPQCVTKDGSPAVNCVSCAAYMGDMIRRGELIREGALVYNEGTRGKEYFDPKTCFTVWPDGSLRNKRLINDGTVCAEGCSKAPEPCPSASPSPGSSPNPGPSPSVCPALVRWGGGLHAQMTPTFQGLPKEPAFAGNTLDFDSTARFGNQAGARGLPCNAEHHAVCSASGDDHGNDYRECEDPRGPIFTVTRGGGTKVKTINGGWGLRVEGAHAGRLCVRIEPRPDVQDALGVPVRVLGDASSESCVEVQ